MAELHTKDTLERVGTALVRGRISNAGICALEARSWARATWAAPIEIPTADLRASGDGTLDGAWKNANGTRSLKCAE